MAAATDAALSSGFHLVQPAASARSATLGKAQSTERQE